MPTQTEQQYQAELLRQRTRERLLREEEETNAQQAGEEDMLGNLGPATAAASSKQKRFNVSMLEAGLGMTLGAMLDWLEWLGALTAVIPVVEWTIAGASAVFFMVLSGILGVLIGLWLFFIKGISIISKDGRAVYIVLFLSVLGNAIFSWLPVWVGFFLWLYVRSFKRDIFKLAGAEF